MQIWREKGLFYFCDNKFSFHRKCPNKQLMMLQLIDEDSCNVFEPEPPDIHQDYAEMIDQEHYLSLNAMRRSGGLGTIDFIRQIGPITVQLLVDGGSSDSFIQPRIAQFLKLPIEPEPCF